MDAAHAVTVGGRTVADVENRIRRYCGLAWSGGPPETWAWRYFDEIPTAHDSQVTRPMSCARRRSSPG